MKNWKEYGIPPSPIAYKGQRDSLLWYNKKTGSKLEVANIFGMGSFNVILVQGISRDAIASGMKREEAIKFAKEWMKNNPEG